MDIQQKFVDSEEGLLSTVLRVGGSRVEDQKQDSSTSCQVDYVHSPLFSPPFFAGLP